MNHDTSILVVEDSATQAELAREILEKEGYRVFHAEDAGKALKMLKERRFDIILSDIEMPGMNGYEFCRRVKDDPAAKDIPVILLTVLSDPADIITGLESGADNFVTKPFEPAYLVAWIKHHLTHLELRKAGSAQAGLEFYFAGRRHFLASDRMQILDILLSTYEVAVRKNRDLDRAQRELELLNRSLEIKVEERTRQLKLELEARGRAERDLRAATEREEMALRTLPMAFFSARPEKGGLRLDWVSEGVEKLCGYKPVEFTTAPNLWFSRIHPEDKNRVQTDLVRLAETGALNTEYRWQAAGGAYRWYLAGATVTGGRALGLWLDISERKTLELQFRQAQKMEAVGRLAGGVAHDFNNLLTAIEGYTDFLLRGLAPDDERRGDALEIKKAAEAAAALTRQLLAFSRQQVLQPRVLDCNAAIRGTQKLLKRLVGENIELALDLPEEECRIKADPGQLEQILMNLVVNARDAMPGGGGVSIKTENVELGEKQARMQLETHPGPHVMISVTDTGSGMDSGTAAHIFEPFFTTKESGKGTGLGLATVYGIVKQSRGNIYVYSEPGLGTTFKIYLPRALAEAEAAPPAAPPPPIPPRGSETILLVEDDASVRGFAKRALRGNGYTVLEAGNAEEAAALWESRAAEIGLLLTDTIMPGLDGHELYGALSLRRPGLKVIFMSGYTGAELVSARLADEKLPFLQKPFSTETLLLKVREVLDAPVAARA
ncbi:MAG: response regulator [Elusimicrobia bacterium]|nr:response regulator [Elusimicrobiota bacterium]